MTARLSLVTLAGALAFLLGPSGGFADDGTSQENRLWPEGLVVGRDLEVKIPAVRELDQLLEMCAGQTVRVELRFEKLDGFGSLASHDLAGSVELMLSRDNVDDLVVPISGSSRAMPERLAAVAVGDCLALGDYYLAEYALGYPDDSLSGVATGAIVFPGDGLDYRSGAGPHNLTFREYLGSITVTADGVVCSKQDLRGLGDFKLLIGRPGEPPECSKPGARITLYEELGRRLLSEFRLEPGVSWTIWAIGPDPTTSVADLGTGASSGSASGDAMADPAPLAPQRDERAASGADSDGRLRVALLAAGVTAAVAIIVGERRLARRR